MSSGNAFVCMDQSARQPPLSPMYLQAPSIALCVVDAIQQGGRSSYILHAWVITPRTDSEVVAEAEEFGRMEKLYRSKPGAPSTKEYADRKSVV